MYLGPNHYFKGKANLKAYGKPVFTILRPVSIAILKIIC